MGAARALPQHLLGACVCALSDAPAGRKTGLSVSEHGYLDHDASRHESVNMSHCKTRLGKDGHGTYDYKGQPKTPEKSDRPGPQILRPPGNLIRPDSKVC